MPFNYLRNGPTELEHHKHGHDNCSNHNLQIVGHTNCGKDGIKTKDDVKQGNLHNNSCEAFSHIGILTVLGSSCFHDLIDLLGSLP